MLIDGVNFQMRIRRNIETVPVLAAIGVIKAGHRLVLSLQSGDKGSASSWREFFQGFEGKNVTLGIMDGLPGLEAVFKQELPSAKVQRCQVHIARNVLAKVPKKLKKEVADDLRSIFYASSKNKAIEFFEQLKKKWKDTIPSAVSCLERSINACLTFFNFPEEEWISLRTTNIIERLKRNLNAARNLWRYLLVRPPVTVSWPLSL
jgi:putative transposase